jgi:hypothetical protein
MVELGKEQGIPTPDERNQVVALPYLGDAYDGRLSSVSVHNLGHSLHLDFSGHCCYHVEKLDTGTNVLRR